MHKIIFKIIQLITAIVIFSNTAFSQTTALDYTTGLGSGCNVFNPSISVNSYPHYSWAGAVQYTASTGIRLAITSSGATAYYISYNFFSGSTYNISIEASSTQNNTVSLNTSITPNLNQFTTSSQTACGSTDATVLGYSTVGIGR